MTLSSLRSLRSQLDQIDKSFLKLLEARKKVVEQVASYKHRHSLPPLDPTRWQKVLDSRKVWGCQLGLDQSFIHDLFTRIHDYSLQIEGRICKK